MYQAINLIKGYKRMITSILYDHFEHTVTIDGANAHSCRDIDKWYQLWYLTDTLEVHRNDEA
jgi:hypothetical protein